MQGRTPKMIEALKIFVSAENTARAAPKIKQKLKKNF
jgi:hypothetical protein